MRRSARGRHSPPLGGPPLLDTRYTGVGAAASGYLSYT